MAGIIENFLSQLKEVPKLRIWFDSATKEGVALTQIRDDSFSCNFFHLPE